MFDAGASAVDVWAVPPAQVVEGSTGTRDWVRRGAPTAAESGRAGHNLLMWTTEGAETRLNEVRAIIETKGVLVSEMRERQAESRRLLSQRAHLLSSGRIAVQGGMRRLEAPTRGCVLLGRRLS
jgi:hypothetical protein